MRLAHLNLLAALISLLGGLLWTIRGDIFPGLIWTAASIVWLAIGIYQVSRRSSEHVPLSSLVRRFSRLLFWS